MNSEVERAVIDVVREQREHGVTEKQIAEFQFKQLAEEQVQRTETIRIPD
jgi:hypothetical protein